MGLHKQYLRVGQSARNKLFGINGRNGFGDGADSAPLNMLISEQGKINHGRLCVIMVGMFAIVLGIILSSVPWVEYLVTKNLKLSNGSLSFFYWQRPGVVRLSKVYIFNITNPQEFLDHGEKPKLKEIGPFVYREDMQKVNIQFHDNGTVTYQHKKILEFVPEMSVNKDEKLTVPNIPLLTLSTRSNYLGFFIQKAISLALLIAKAKPFVSVTADELVFGYDDPLTALAHRFYPRNKRPMSKMGLLIARNGTLKEVSTIHTGYTGMENFGYLDRLNGLDHLPYWNEEPCTNIRASEGTFFPPRDVTKADIVHVYDKDLCRIIPLQYREPTVKDGINADLYTPPDDLFETVENAPENKCYCPGNDFCPPKGLQNISPCQYDAPVYLSFPHYYKADPELMTVVEGMNPDKEKHETYFKINPRLGVPVEGKVRVQLNLRVERAKNVASVSKFPDIIIPIMWIEEGVGDLTPAINRWLYIATTVVDIIGPVTSYGSIVLGFLLLIGVFVKAYKNFVFNRETIELIEMGKDTIRRGSNILINAPHKLMVARESYSLLTPSSHTGMRLANHRDDDEQALML